MTGPVIEIKDLVKRYDGRSAVLDGVSFSVDEGEFVTVYGKSGCGKTTLLNILGGLDRPSAGSVVIDGEDIVGLSENDLARFRLEKIGFVFQDFNLLTNLTVRENVALPFRFSRKRDMGKVDSLLDRFDISHIADETANTISGGEAQRTAIARAMVNEPRIVLADEPTGNLDADNTRSIIEMFESARTSFGTTTVLATHDLDLAEHSTSMILLESSHAEMRPGNAPQRQ